MPRRHRLGESHGGRANQPAAGEHLERARSLTDEMRRRLEPRTPVDATGGQQRHAVLAEEPGGGLGGVARVGVVGQQGDEPTAELDVERGQEQRQRRLRDASATRQRSRERGQARICAQALDEAVENGTVHEKRRNDGSGAVIVVGGSPLPVSPQIATSSGRANARVESGSAASPLRV